MRSATFFKYYTPIALSLIAVVTIAVYFRYLGNPIFFDDATPGALDRLILSFPDELSLRIIAHVAFWINSSLTGYSIYSLRSGNVLIHLGNVLLIYAISWRLAVLAKGNPESIREGKTVATIAALIFAIHPVATYAVGYLIQRSILLSTFFGLIAVFLHLKGQMNNKPYYFCLAALAYLFSTFSKEHSVMLMFWFMALTYWLDQRGYRWQKNWLLYCLPYALVFGVTVWARSSLPAGEIYEPYVADLNVPYPYLTSLGTQFILFFRYLGVWMLPLPQWMSIDMQTNLPLYAFPFWGLAGGAVFIGATVYFLLKLRKSGAIGLFSLAYLWFAMLFCTEFWAPRLAEVFVLYRSYLWFSLFLVGGVALFGEYVVRWCSGKMLAFGGAFVLAFLFWAANDRLMSMSSQLNVWRDAASKNIDIKWPVAARSFNWTAISYSENGDQEKARYYFNMAINKNPNNDNSYCNLAMLSYRENKIAEVNYLVRQAMQINPNRPCVLH